MTKNERVVREQSQKMKIQGFVREMVQDIIQKAVHEAAVCMNSPLRGQESLDFISSRPMTTEATGLTPSMTPSKMRLPTGPEDFKLLCVIGKGAFGKVVQVIHEPTQEVLAMKIVCKQFLVESKTVSYMKAERDIMCKINHPFLVRLKYAFQTEKNVYLVMPYIAGGEIFRRLHKEGLLLEKAARFYAAEMVLALEHLHALGIIHRDLKPENILLGADGHVCLTDFGLAKEFNSDDESATTICGTNEYMAPEMIRGQAYNKAVDWWALGALIFEMVVGSPPFRHKNKKKLHEKILSGKLQLPQWLHASTHSILKQLLDRNVDRRLGSGKSSMFKIKGVPAIKAHPFFKDIDWTLLAQKKVLPPLIPQVQDELDTSHFDEEFTRMTLSPQGEKAKDTTTSSHHTNPKDDTTNDDSTVRRSRLFSKFAFNAEDFTSPGTSSDDKVHQQLGLNDHQTLCDALSSSVPIVADEQQQQQQQPFDDAHK